MSARDDKTPSPRQGFISVNGKGVPTGLNSIGLQAALGGQLSPSDWKSYLEQTMPPNTSRKDAPKAP